MREGRTLAVVTVVLLATFVAQGATVMAGVVTKDQVCDARADYFLRMEDYPEAVEFHRRVTAAHPDDALAHYHLGFAYGMLGGHDDELAEYRRAASLGLKRWDLFLNLGLVYLEDSNLQVATVALMTAASLGPNHPEAHFNLGLAYERRRMFAQARQEMLTSLRLGPSFAPAAVNLADLDRELGRDAEGKRVLRAALSRLPADASLQHALGLLLVREGQRQEALEHLAEATRLDPDDSRFAFAYAVALNDCGHHQEAIDVLTKALEKQPYDRDSLASLAAFYSNAGNREFLERRGEGLHHLGFFLEDKGKFDEVIDALGRNFEVLQSGRFGDVQFVYFDTEAAIGSIMEVVYLSPTSSFSR